MVASFALVVEFTFAFYLCFIFFSLFFISSFMSHSPPSFAGLFFSLFCFLPISSCTSLPLCGPYSRMLLNREGDQFSFGVFPVHGVDKGLVKLSLYALKLRVKIITLPLRKPYQSSVCVSSVLFKDTDSISSVLVSFRTFSPPRPPPHRTSTPFDPPRGSPRVTLFSRPQPTSSSLPCFLSLCVVYIFPLCLCPHARVPDSGSISCFCLSLF